MHNNEDNDQLTQLLTREFTGDETVSSKDHAEDEAAKLESDTQELCSYLARNFVRKEGRFYKATKPGSAMSASDLKRVLLLSSKREFPHITMSKDLWREVCRIAIDTVHDDETQTIPFWDDRIECCPNIPRSTFLTNGMASINSWVVPSYRGLPVEGADMTMLEEFLGYVFKHRQDREIFLDWLAYSLQKEGSKPAWSILLYSRSKGTGKSTLCTLLRLLFGERNSLNLNGISKLTGRFNRTVMTRKLITCEEVKLKAGTDQGNTVKSLISECEVAVEGKGKEVESITQVCVFVFTTNHFPYWIEADDRRFLVIDCDHLGHASGPNSDVFRRFMEGFYGWMNEPENLTRLRNALLSRQLSNSFNPKALNTGAIGTPIMEKLRANSGEVLQETLKEILHSRKVFATTQQDLIRIFSGELRANPNRIRHIMEELGWYHTSAKFGVADYARAVWVHPDYQLSRGRVTGPDQYDEPIKFIEEVELID